MGKPILCLDFDGVIHSYVSGWKGADVIPDPPVPGAIDFIVDAQNHFNVAIHSSRMGHPGGTEAIREYLIKHGITREYVATSEEMGNREWDNGAIVLSGEKPSAFMTLDDRALTFTGTWPDPVDLKSFIPWHKLKPGSNDSPAPWAEAVARVLYDRMEAIDGEAMNDAQIAQDERSGRETWEWKVANIIKQEYSRFHLK